MSRALSGAAPLLLYAALSLVMTWPLAANLARDVPGDLGDALLNMWILGWMAESIPRVAAGEMRVAEVWHANIFHPEPLALSFSEHLFGQALQILPVYHLTHNLILAYNLLFLASFALSGFFMYLLVRDLTGSRAAAFLAGLIYAFVPFRIAQVAHIQSLNSQWMPLALWGFRRFIVAPLPPARMKPRPPAAAYAWLGVGSAALLLQNWSNGYYLIFFAPFVLLFVVHQIFAARRAADWKLWLAFAAAAVLVAAGTWPFLSLYLEAQRVHGFERSTPEIVRFSADVYSYFTAPDALRLFGRVLNAWPKPEGELFLGFVAMAMGLMAVALAIRDAVAGGAEAPPSRALNVVAAVLVAAVALLLAALAALLLTGGFVTSIAGIPLRATNASRLLTNLAIAFVVLLLISARARRAGARFVASPAGIAFICFVLAVWLSFGPVVHSRGRAIDGVGLYSLLLDHMPGFAGLRVPARYAMIAALFLSILAGLGAARLLAAGARRGMEWPRPAIAAASVVVLAETAFAPMLVNQTWGAGAIVPPPRVEPAGSAPAVYRHLAQMPGDVVLAEFPFGDPAWELRYVYYSTVHWKRLLNGYSGGFPQGYKVRVARLQRLATVPGDAWSALREAGATHVVLHEAAMTPDEAARTRAWLQQAGAREIGRFDRDLLFEIR